MKMRNGESGRKTDGQTIHSRRTGRQDRYGQTDCQAEKDINRINRKRQTGRQTGIQIQTYREEEDTDREKKKKKTQIERKRRRHR
jgi:hypothetical protein